MPIIADWHWEELIHIDQHWSLLRNIGIKCLEFDRTLIHIDRHWTLIHHVLWNTWREVCQHLGIFILCRVDVLASINRSVYTRKSPLKVQCMEMTHWRALTWKAELKSFSTVYKAGPTWIKFVWSNLFAQTLFPLILVSDTFKCHQICLIKQIWFANVWEQHNMPIFAQYRSVIYRRKALKLIFWNWKEAVRPNRGCAFDREEGVYISKDSNGDLTWEN